MITEVEDMDFLDVFGRLDDPRIERKELHPLPEILLLTLCAVICGTECWDDIEMSGKSKLVFYASTCRMNTEFRAMTRYGGFSAPLTRHSSNACLWSGSGFG
jgi:hypothetical protein